MIFGILFWVGLIVGVVWYMRNKRASFEAETQTTLPSEDAIRLAAQTYTMNGWEVTSRSGDSATFVRNVKGSCLIAVVLFLIGFVPGLIYLWFMGRSINASVYARPGGVSSTTVQISSSASGWGARATAERLIRDLAPPTGPKSYAATPQIPMRSGSEIREDAYEELSREEEKQQRVEEAQRRREVEARAEAKMLPPMPQQLASVSGIVDLSADEALDEAQGFLTRQGYDVVTRTDNSLTMRRGGQQFFLPDSASTFTSTLEVLVHPQPGGGVRVKIMGHDSDPVPRQQQAQWSEWADSLPRKTVEEEVAGTIARGHETKEEANTTAEEKTTVSPVEADTGGERDISDLLERFQAAEDRLGVRLEGLFAKRDQENGRIHLNGELHARDEGGELGRDLEIIATVHDSSGRMVHKQSTTCRSESFFGFEAFSLSLEAGRDVPAKIRVYPKAL